MLLRVRLCYQDSEFEIRFCGRARDRGCKFGLLIWAPGPGVIMAFPNHVFQFLKLSYE